MGTGGWRQAPAALLRGKTQYSLHGRLGGHHSRCGQEMKTSHPPGFEYGTVQTVKSHHTDHANPAQIIKTCKKLYTCYRTVHEYNVRNYMYYIFTRIFPTGSKYPADWMTEETSRMNVEPIQPLIEWLAIDNFPKLRRQGRKVCH